MKLWGGLGVFSQSKRATNCATPGYRIVDAKLICSQSTNMRKAISYISIVYF